MVANGNLEKTKFGNEKVHRVATLDEAMMETGLGTYNLLHTLLSGLILMGVIMQNLAMGYIMPAAQCDLELTVQQKGWLAAIPFIAVILTSHLWGFLADTRGRQRVMQLSMLVSTVFSVTASFAPNLAAFAVLQFLSAIFMSGTSAVVYTYLGEFNNLRHRDKMVAFGASFVGIGTVALPAISWLILPLDFSYYIPLLDIEYRPWRLMVVACAMPYALSVVLLQFAADTPKYLSASGQLDECLEVLKSMYAVNKRMPRDTFSVKALTSEYQRPTVEETGRKGMRAIMAAMKDQTVPLFKMPHLPWTLLACFVQFGMFAATNGFYIWFPTILNSLAIHEGGETRICDVLDAQRNSLTTNATSVTCDDTINVLTYQRSIYIGLVFSSMYIVVGFLVDFVGKKPILIFVLGGAGLCGIGAHLASNQQLAVVLFAIFQMSGACIGLMNAVAVELFPTKFRLWLVYTMAQCWTIEMAMRWLKRNYTMATFSCDLDVVDDGSGNIYSTAMAICLSMMVGRVGSVFGSNLIGYFLEVNCGAGFYLFGSILIACAALCLTLPARNKSTGIPGKTKTVESIQNETHEPV